MSDFQVTDIPRKEGAPTSWKEIAGALRENPGKAVFVPRSGDTLSFASAAHSSIRHYLPAGTTLRTKRTDDGVYLWLDSEVLP